MGNTPNAPAPAQHITSIQAFGVAKIGRAQKAIQRKLDLGHRRDHSDVVERRALVPAPYIVVVMGPPGSGKSTLIKVRARAPRREATRVGAPLLPPRGASSV